MYATIKHLYSIGKLSDKGLTTAVKKGWITKEQAEELKAAKRNA